MNARSRCGGGQRQVDRRLVGFQAAPVGLAEDLDVELLLVAEVVVDRRQVRSRPLADRPHPRQLEPLLGKLFTGRLEQPYLRRVLCHHVTLHAMPNNRFKQPVSIKCIRDSDLVNGEADLFSRDAPETARSPTRGSRARAPASTQPVKRLLATDTIVPGIPSDLTQESENACTRMAPRSFGPSAQTALHGAWRGSLPEASVDPGHQPRVLGDEADEMAVSRFEGKATSLADVLDELRTLPFFSKRRIVIVEEADPFVTKYRKELEAHVASPSGAGVLILMLKSWPSNTKLYKLVEASGLAIDCSNPGEKDLVPWLTHLATSGAPGASRSRRGPAPGRAGGRRGRNPGVRGREAGRLRGGFRQDPPRRRRQDGGSGTDRDGLEGASTRPRSARPPRP